MVPLICLVYDAPPCPSYYHENDRPGVCSLNVRPYYKAEVAWFSPTLKCKVTISEAPKVPHSVVGVAETVM